MLIYLFRHVPSGRVYAGKHECALCRDVPRRGTGFLPCCNYSGSSTKGAPWHNLRRKHPSPGEYEYIILQRPQEDTWSAAERRAIRLVRAVWGHAHDDGGRCLNLADGGDGITSEEARRLYENPEFRAKHEAANRALAKDPAWRAANATLWADPDFRERNHDSVLATMTPERNAQMGATHRKLYEDPEYGARVTAAVRTGIAKRAERLRTVYRATDKATVGKNENKRQWLLANGPCTGAELLASGLWDSFRCVSYDLRRGFISCDPGSPEAASA